MDPCLFVIDRWINRDSTKNPFNHASNDSLDDLDDSELPDNVARVWMLIHTDDCDAYSSSMETMHEINSRMNDKWKTEIVDSSFVLGVKRELIINDDGKWQCKVSMRQYIEDMYESFAEDIGKHLGRRVPKIPFPENRLVKKTS